MEEEINIKQLYCLNCGKRGHISKKCKDPPTSYGIICYKIVGEWNIYQNIMQIKYYKNHLSTHINNINMYWFNNKKKEIKDQVYLYINKIKNDIKFLLIRRKHSLGYIEFIRGRYDITNEQTIIHLLEQMTDNEREMIKNSIFDVIWDDLWRNTSRSKMYEKEYNKSKEKFDYIKTNINNILVETKGKYEIAEWGFPKGRRNYMEKDIECAQREFCEESGLKNHEYVVLDRIYPLYEVFNGTNQIKYKHVYYMGVSNISRNLEIYDNKTQMQEIGDIGWFNYYEMIKMIRPYHTERLKLIDDLIDFIAFNIKYYQENDTIKTLKLIDWK